MCGGHDLLNSRSAWFHGQGVPSAAVTLTKPHNVSVVRYGCRCHQGNSHAPTLYGFT